LTAGATVVLSACNTGRGQILAEGVVGISRAFLAAKAGLCVNGCVCVCVCEWVWVSANTDTDIDTDTEIDRQTHVYVHAHACTHTHTYILSFSAARSSYVVATVSRID